MKTQLNGWVQNEEFVRNVRASSQTSSFFPFYPAFSLFCLATLTNLAEALEVDIGEMFGLLQVEDPSRRKSLIKALLKEADSEQLKVALKVLSELIR